MAEGVGFLDLHRRPMKSLLTTRGVGQICYWAILGYIGRRNPKGRFNRPSRPSPAAVGVGPTVRHAQETWRHVRPWEAFWLYKSQWTMMMMTIPQLWETNPWFLTAPRIFGSMVGWAMWGLCPLSTVAVEKRLKMWQQNLSGFYHGWWWRIHRPRHLSLLVFVTSHVWKREKIAMLDPLSKFRDAGGGPKKEKSDRPPHWWFKPLCFLLMTHLLYLLFHLFHLFGDLIWLVYLVMWFSCTFLDLPRIRHRVRRATDRSSRRRRCHPKSGRRGCHWLRKNAGKPWIYQPNNAKYEGWSCMNGNCTGNGFLV